MTAYLGRSMTLKSGTWSGGTTITQVRTHTLTHNNASIDITNKDSNGWRQMMEGGIRSQTITLEGIVDNSTVFESFQAACFAGTIGTYALGSVADGDVYEGSFQPANFAITGNFDGEQTFTATLESSGAITYTAA